MRSASTLSLDRERNEGASQLHASKLTKLLVAAALAVAALGITPLAQATADFPPGPGKASVAAPPWEA